MAQTITEDKERRIQQINKGQWDGALGVKSLTLPGVDTSSVNTTNPVTSETEEHSYKQEYGTYNFTSIKIEDMFQGFNQAQHYACGNDLDNIRDIVLMSSKIFPFIRFGGQVQRRVLIKSRCIFLTYGQKFSSPLHKKKGCKAALK